jgi:hypothetical protein
MEGVLELAYASSRHSPLMKETASSSETLASPTRQDGVTTMKIANLQQRKGESS